MSNNIDILTGLNVEDAAARKAARREAAATQTGFGTEQLLRRTAARNVSAPPIVSDVPQETPTTPQTGFIPSFKAGLEAGGYQIAGDFERFKALTNFYFGDESDVEENLRRARVYDNAMQETYNDLQGFEDLVNEPTFEGGVDFIGRSIGQFTPMAITSIASGFTGAATALLGRYGISKTGRAALGEIFSNTIRKKVVKGEALDAVERNVMNAVQSMGRTAAAGGFTGAGSTEFVVGAAQALSEFEEAGVRLTREEANSALIMGVPQALLGVVSDTVFAGSLYKMIFRRSAIGRLRAKEAKIEFEKNLSGGQATTKLSPSEQELKRIADKVRTEDVNQIDALSTLTPQERRMYVAALGTNPSLGRLFKDVAFATAVSSGVEGTTELLQEELFIQQRLGVDPDYGEQEQRLRRMESFFAGAAAGGARGVVGTPVSSVFRQAREYIDKYNEKESREATREELFQAEEDLREQASESVMNIVGDITEGKFKAKPGGQVSEPRTSPEPIAQLRAQYRAMLLGDKPSMFLPEGTDSRVIKQLSRGRVGDKKIFVANIPGVGTFLSPSKEKIDGVFENIQDRALLGSDTFIANFLGYTNPKRENDDRVIVVRDNNGNVVHEQATDQSGQDLAERKAGLFFKEEKGYTITVENPDDVLQDRQNAVKIERAKADRRRAAKEKGQGAFDFGTTTTQTQETTPPTDPKRIVHFTLPENVAKILKEGFDTTKPPVHGLRDNDIRRPFAATDKIGEDIVYFTTDEDRWSSTTVYVGEGKGNLEAVYYDYDAQKWVKEQDAMVRVDLARVEAGIKDSARVLTLDSYKKVVDYSPSRYRDELLESTLNKAREEGYDVVNIKYENAEKWGTDEEAFQKVTKNGGKDDYFILNKESIEVIPNDSRVEQDFDRRGSIDDIDPDDPDLFYETMAEAEGFDPEDMDMDSFNQEDLEGFAPIELDDSTESILSSDVAFTGSKQGVQTAPIRDIPLTKVQQNVQPEKRQTEGKDGTFEFSKEKKTQIEGARNRYRDFMSNDGEFIIPQSLESLINKMTPELINKFFSLQLEDPEGDYEIYNKGNPEATGPRAPFLTDDEKIQFAIRRTGKSGRPDIDQNTGEYILTARDEVLAGIDKSTANAADRMKQDSSGNMVRGPSPVATRGQFTDDQGNLKTFRWVLRRPRKEYDGNPVADQPLNMNDLIFAGKDAYRNLDAERTYLDKSYNEQLAMGFFELVGVLQEANNSIPNSNVSAEGFYTKRDSNKVPVLSNLTQIIYEETSEDGSVVELDLTNPADNEAIYKKPIYWNNGTTFDEKGERKIGYQSITEVAEIKNVEDPDLEDKDPRAGPLQNTFPIVSKLSKAMTQLSRRFFGGDPANYERVGKPEGIAILDEDRKAGAVTGLVPPALPSLVNVSSLTQRVEVLDLSNIENLDAFTLPASVQNIVVAGSRYGPDGSVYNNQNLVSQVLDKLTAGRKDLTIFSGAARGVDTLGENWAKENGVPIRQFEPEWNYTGGPFQGKFNPGAGYQRNTEMAQEANGKYPEEDMYKNARKRYKGDRYGLPPRDEDIDPELLTGAAVVFWDGKSKGSAQMIEQAVLPEDRKTFPGGGRPPIITPYNPAAVVYVIDISKDTNLDNYLAGDIKIAKYRPETLDEATKDMSMRFYGGGSLDATGVQGLNQPQSRIGALRDELTAIQMVTAEGDRLDDVEPNRGRDPSLEANQGVPIVVGDRFNTPKRGLYEDIVNSIAGKTFEETKQLKLQFEGVTQIFNRVLGGQNKAPDRADRRRGTDNIPPPFVPSMREVYWSGSPTVPNRAFSNLAPRPFTYLGKRYQSVEHAYQTLKTGKFKPDVFNRREWKKAGGIFKDPAAPKTDYVADSSSITFAPFKDLATLEKQGKGINTMRNRPGKFNFGNPWSHLDKVAAGTIKVKTLQEAVDNYEAWLDGKAFNDVRQDQRNWILKQIDENRLKDKKLLYYNDPSSNSRINHALVLARRVNGKEGVAYNVDLMEKLMLASFEQNPDATKQLLDTGSDLFTHYGDRTNQPDKFSWAQSFPEMLLRIRERLGGKKPDIKKALEEFETSLYDASQDLLEFPEFDRREGDGNKVLQQPNIRSLNFLGILPGKKDLISLTLAALRVLSEPDKARQKVMIKGFLEETKDELIRRANDPNNRFSIKELLLPIPLEHRPAFEEKILNEIDNRIKIIEEIILNGYDLADIPTDRRMAIRSDFDFGETTATPRGDFRFQEKVFAYPLPGASEMVIYPPDAPGNIFGGQEEFVDGKPGAVDIITPTVAKKLLFAVEDFLTKAQEELANRTGEFENTRLLNVAGLGFAPSGRVIGDREESSLYDEEVADDARKVGTEVVAGMFQSQQEAYADEVRNPKAELNLARTNIEGYDADNIDFQQRQARLLTERKRGEKEKIASRKAKDAAYLKGKNERTITQGLGVSSKAQALFAKTGEPKTGMAFMRGIKRAIQNELGFRNVPFNTFVITTADDDIAFTNVGADETGSPVRFRDIPTRVKKQTRVLKKGPRKGQTVQLGAGAPSVTSTGVPFEIPNPAMTKLQDERNALIEKFREQTTTTSNIAEGTPFLSKQLEDDFTKKKAELDRKIAETPPTITSSEEAQTIPEGTVRGEKGMEFEVGGGRVTRRARELPNPEYTRLQAEREDLIQNFRGQDALTSDISEQYKKLEADFVDKKTELDNRIAETQPTIKNPEVGPDEVAFFETVKTIEGTKQVNEYIKQMQRRVAQNPNEEAAQLLRFGNKNVIIIKDIPQGTQKTESQVYTRMLSLMHELGHVFFHEELRGVLNKDTEGGRKMLATLREAYEKDRDTLNEPYYYSEHGFEEWYADQFAKAIVRISAGERGDPDLDTLGPLMPRVRNYFNTLAKKLVEFTKKISGLFEKRFGTDYGVEFDSYLQTVRKHYRNKLREGNDGHIAANTTFAARDAIEYINNTKDSIVGGAKDVADKSRFNFKAPRSSRAHWSWRYLVYPADNTLSYYADKKTNSDREAVLVRKIQRSLYTRSRTRREDTGTSYLNLHPNINSRVYNSFTAIFGLKDPTFLDQDEIEMVERTLLNAEDFTKYPNNETLAAVDTKAVRVRKFLDGFYRTYLRDTGIAYHEQFFPRSLFIFALLENKNNEQGKLAALLQSKWPEIKDFNWNEYVRKMLIDDDAVLDNIEDNDEKVSQEDLTDIAVGGKRERSKYFKRITNEELREIGVLKDPVESVREYLNSMVKRAVYNRAFVTPIKEVSSKAIDLLESKKIFFSKAEKAAGKVTGWKALEADLAELATTNPKLEQMVRHMVKGMLGKAGQDMSSGFRNINSFFLFFNSITLLTLAPLASLPDLAGPMLFSADKGAFSDAKQVLQEYFSEPGGKQRLREFAFDVGAVSADSLSMYYINAAEQNYMTPMFRKGTDYFFRYTFLEGFTIFSRVFATGMARQFLVRAADAAKNGDKVKAAQLRELNVTPAQIDAWIADGKVISNQHQRVKEAIAQFVDESIVRPNAAERPGWANNPYFAMVWQLKSFYYAYGKTIMGGLGRLAKTKQGVEGMAAGVAPLIMGAVLLAPLTMLGLEIRELLKYLISGGDSRKLRTNSMDAGEYSFEILDRSGILGPLGLLIPMYEAGKYGDFPLGPAAGPTFERIEDLIFDFEVKQNIPVLGTIL